MSRNDVTGSFTESVPKSASAPVEETMENPSLSESDLLVSNRLSDFGNTSGTTKCTLYLQDHQLAATLIEMCDDTSTKAFVEGLSVTYKDVHAISAIREDKYTTLQYNSLLDCLQAICLTNNKLIGNKSNDGRIVFFNPVKGVNCEIKLQEGFAANSGYLNIKDVVEQHGFVPFESLNPALFDVQRMERVGGECLGCSGALTAIGMDDNLAYWAAQCRYCVYNSDINPMSANVACVWTGEEYARLVELETCAVKDKDTKDTENTAVVLRPLQVAYSDAKEFVRVLGPLVKWENEQENRFYDSNRLFGRLKDFITVTRGKHYDVIRITASAESNALWQEINQFNIGKVAIEIIPYTGFIIPNTVVTSSFMIKHDSNEVSSGVLVNVLLEGGYNSDMISKGDAVYIKPQRKQKLVEAITRILTDWWDNSETYTASFITQCLLDPRKMLNITKGITDISTLFISDISNRQSYQLLFSRCWKSKTEQLPVVERCLGSGMSILEGTIDLDVNIICAKVLLALKLHFPLHTTLVIGASASVCDEFCSTYDKTINEAWFGIIPFRLLRIMPFNETIVARQKVKSTASVEYLHECVDFLVQNGPNEDMKAIQKLLEDESFWKLGEEEANAWYDFVSKYERNQMESTRYPVLVTTMEGFAEFEMHNLFQNRTRYIDSIIILEAGAIPQIQLVPLSRLMKVTKLILTKPFIETLKAPEPLTKTGQMAGFSTTLIDIVNK